MSDSQRLRLDALSRAAEPDRPVKERMNAEEQFVAAFIRPEKRHRYRELLANPKRRRAFLGRLAHNTYDFVTERCVEIPSSEQSPADIERRLRQLGAGSTCLAISVSAELDGKEHDLRKVLEAIVGYGQGTCLSCVLGTLGYYEGEGPKERMILLKKPKK